MLDKIELTVSRTIAKAKLYDGTLVDCTVYSNPLKTEDPNGDKPPEERYVEIMIEGASMFGVSQEYIQKLRDMENVPRKAVSDF